MGDKPSHFGAFQGYNDIAHELPDLGELAGPVTSPEKPQTPTSPSAGPLVTASVVDLLGLRKLFKSLETKPDPAQPATNPEPSHKPVQYKEVFMMSQTDSSYLFKGHPATMMVVAYLQKNLDFQWDGQPVQKTIFPNISSILAPAHLTAPGLEEAIFNNGAVALLVKAFYNTCKDQQGNILIDKATTAVQALNDHVSAQATSLLVQFYQVFFSITPSTIAVEKYKTLLLSPAYRNLKLHQASQGVWANPSLEMFCHFAKLEACGASAGDIKAIFNELTTKAPALDAGIFGAIVPGTWRSYRGWLSSGYLDWADFGATDLGASKWITGVSSGTATSGPLMYSYQLKLVEEFISKTSYKKPTFSSCVSGDTRVVMAGTGERRCIRNVNPGDVVVCHEETYSAPFDAIPARERTVAFVSKPLRQGRTLYSVNGYPGVRFTSTHPIILPPRKELSTTLQGSQAPRIVSFVDKDEAASLNPTWQSLLTRNIDQEMLVTHDPDLADDQILYDLVFDPSDALESTNGRVLDTYLAEADNGRLLTIASEAPILSWFPFESIFLGSVLQRFMILRLNLEAMIDFITSAHVSTRMVLEEAATKVALAQALTTEGAKNQTSNAATATQKLLEFTEASELTARLLKICKSSQAMADIAEKMIIYLGRTLTHEIRNGWIRFSSSAPPPPPPPPRGQSQTTKHAHHGVVLFFNIFRIMDDAYIHENYTEIDPEQYVRIWCNDLLVFDGVVQGSVQGRTTLEIYHPILLDSNAYSHVDETTALEFVIHVGKEHSPGNFWMGRSPMYTHIPTMVSLGNAIGHDVDIPQQHAVAEMETRSIAILDNASSSVDNNAHLASLHASWDQDRMGEYAAALGIEMANCVADMFVKYRDIVTS